MTASASASASASTLPPDSRPFSSRRRLAQLRANSNAYLSSTSSNSSSRPNRNPLSSRTPSTSHSTNPDLSSVGGNLPIPCAQSYYPSAISRYRQAFFGCYRDIGLDLHASSDEESSVSAPSDDSEGEGETQQSMARLRRPRTSSHNSPTPDPSQPADTQDPQDRSNRSSSSHPGSSSNQQTASPAPPDQSTAENITTPEESSTPENASTVRPNQKATIRFYPHQDFHRNSRPSLHFIPVSRTIPSDNCVIRVGRYSERDGVPVANPGAPSGAPVGFKSKVVSRRHCEFLYINAQWHVKDVGSSSGTFLNHMRLSQPNMASRLYPIKDGDIVQLGIDFRGGEEMIFRSVRMRIECNRSWQRQPNEFNKNTESLIKNLGKGDTADYSGCRECSICLGSVLRPYQCLFMAACAHVWHYKCVSPLIHSPEYPMFQCPNCRAYTDLSAEVDDTNDLDDKEEKETEREQASSEEHEGRQAESEESQGEPEAPRAEEAQPSAGMPEHERDSPSESEEPGSEPNSSRPASQEQPQSESHRETPNTSDSSEEAPAPASQDQSQSESRGETPNTSDSSEEAPVPTSHPSFVPLPALPLQMDPLSTPSLEEALAINFDGLDLQNARTRTETETPDESNLPEATSDSNASHPDNEESGIQSTNPINAVHARHPHLGTATPSRSESPGENPLTPRNDAGPLALDGRAGMQ